MTKPKNYYLKPSIEGPVAWFLSHYGLVPMPVMIDTVEEYATITELPLNYGGEDALYAIVDR